MGKSVYNNHSDSNEPNPLKGDNIHTRVKFMNGYFDTEMFIANEILFLLFFIYCKFNRK